MAKLFIGLFAILLFVVGCFSVLVSKSDIQIILAVLSFGFSFLLISQLAVIRAIEAASREKVRT